MRPGWIAVIALALGCVKATSVTCEDGRVCPAGDVCAAGQPLCISQDQASSCEGLGEGDLCQADGRDGRCTLGSCLFMCGDGVLDPGEQCDDGNYVNHDSCSSACLTETLAWELWTNPWRARFWHGAAYDPDHDRLLVVGGYQGGFLDDIWAREKLHGGSTWAAVPVPSAPAPRQATVAYDPERHVLVLFGGRQFSELGDTWEFDGTTWQQRALTPSPAGRFFHGMVWDAKRKKIVLFGGAAGSAGISTVFDDTWEYDGTWTQLTTPTKPSARANFAMGYDPVREKVVVFGGSPSNNETWELSGSTWTQVTGGTEPAARNGAAMAFSQGDGKLVMFGGNSATTLFAETWHYDGSWTKVSIASQPESTHLHTLTSIGDRLILVGGQTASGASDQVWEYHPTPPRWLRVTSAVTPANKSLAQSTTGFGGNLMTYALDETMWTFEANRWTPAVTDSLAPAPATRFNNALAFDSTRNKLLLFGGVTPDNTALFGDSWLWDGASWQDITATATVEGGPSPRADASAAYDASRDRVVLFGGYTSAGLTDETWEFDGTAWRRDMGSPPPAQVLAAMAYDPVGSRIIVLDAEGKTHGYTASGWSDLAIPALAPALSGSAMVFDPWRRRMIVFGGFDAAATLSSALFELTEDGWHALAPVGEAPSARYGAGLGVDRVNHELVLFGGTELGANPGDTWFLHYRSATPEEVCDDGDDNDGDAHTDADDPDCALL